MWRASFLKKSLHQSFQVISGITIAHSGWAGEYDACLRYSVYLPNIEHVMRNSNTDIHDTMF